MWRQRRQQSTLVFIIICVKWIFLFSVISIWRFVFFITHFAPLSVERIFRKKNSKFCFDNDVAQSMQSFIESTLELFTVFYFIFFLIDEKMRLKIEMKKLTWKCKMIVQIRPSVNFGLPSTISSARMLTNLIFL